MKTGGYLHEVRLSACLCVVRVGTLVCVLYVLERLLVCRHCDGALCVVVTSGGWVCRTNQWCFVCRGNQWYFVCRSNQWQLCVAIISSGLCVVSIVRRNTVVCVCVLSLIHI